MKEFLETYDIENGRITLHSFINYYSNIGSSIDSDEYFSLLIRNVWQVEDDMVEVKKDGMKQRVREPSSIGFAAGTKTNAIAPSVLKWVGYDNSSQFEGFTDRTRYKIGEANQGEQMIISNLKKEIIGRGVANGFISIQRKFHTVDLDGGKLLSLPEFSRALKELRFTLTDSELRVVFNYFDFNRKGLMDYRVFIEGVRTPLSSKRLALVTNAFDKLDRYNESVLDASQIINAFDPCAHPDVLLGIKDSETVLQEWLSTFDVSISIDGKVTKNEFINYYTNVSITIDNEDYFQLMLVNSWPSTENELEEEERGIQYQNLPDSSSQSLNVGNNESELDVKNGHMDFLHHQNQYFERPESASMQNWREAYTGVHGIKSNIGVLAEKGKYLSLSLVHIQSLFFCDYIYIPFICIVGNIIIITMILNSIFYQKISTYLLSIVFIFLNGFIAYLCDHLSLYCSIFIFVLFSFFLVF